MKLAAIFLSLIMMSSSFAESYSCLKNRSESYIVAINDVEDGGTSVTLTLQHWMGTVIQTQELSYAQTVRYGNTTIVLQDAGRSGYALVRIGERKVINPATEQEEVQLVGNFDINLFLQEKINTDGMFETYCTKL